MMSNDENDPDNSSIVSDGEDSSESEAELMITTREKRKTAGNRYSQVVAQEQFDDDAEDDVALLFAEADGEDEEYNSAEADDEADMSSSDDDDQGPNAAPDDLDGEKELEKQAKAERQKKRKADMAMTTLSAIRKKPKIDPTSLHRAVDKLKPSKKKERVSWLPDEASAPGRTSKRKQTVAHREVMLERLKESEEQRLKNKAIREEKERIKQAEAPKELTQADRLAEAEKNERRNAKSLNRWEAMEARRAEEQAAKLAALKERKLDGAVITFHSSAHVYRGPKITQTYSGPYTADGSIPKKRGPKPKVSQLLPSTAASPIQPVPALAPVIPSNQVPIYPLSSPAASQVPVSSPAIPASSTNGLLAGINEYAYMPSMPNSNIMKPPKPESLKEFSDLIELKDEQVGKAPVSHESSAAPKRSQSPAQVLSQTEHTIGAQPSKEGPAIAQSELQPVEPLQEPSSTKEFTTNSIGPDSVAGTNAIAAPITLTEQKSPVVGDFVNHSVTMASNQNKAEPATVPVSTPDQGQIEAQAVVPISAPTMALMPSPNNSADITPDVKPELPEKPEIPMEEVTSTRNLVILDRLEALTVEAKQAFNVFNGTKRSSKPAKHIPEICLITGSPARYRDPVTGIGYANVNAYRKLQDLQQHKFHWSTMLGCYVGQNGQAARGVPQAFLG